MGDKVRVGAVSYLNTRPLVFGFEQGVAADRIELSYDVPSVLADRLAGGQLDVALLPSIEVARIGGLAIVPGLAITAQGPVQSVLLVARKPIAEIRSVALDPESRTSNALTRILFATHWKTQPTFAPGPRDLDLALSEFDAAVRIGDKALFDPVPEGCVAYDLGAAWKETTGLPFVYAVWAAKPRIVDRSLYRAFHLSRRLGAQVLEAIGADYTWRGKQFPSIAIPYLVDTMRYRLGSQEAKALRLFWKLAAGLGVLERAPEPVIAFYPDHANACVRR